MASLKPDVLWAQRPDSVYLTIDLKEVQDMKVTLETDKLSFSGKVGGSTYEFTVEFFAPIKKEDSKWSTKRLIEFYLKKETEETWSGLTKGKKLPFVKVDWKRWQDSDDEGDGGKGAFNLDGMGDMNFGDMGGDDYDSDDEDQDLPDLDPGEQPLGAAAAAPAAASSGGYSGGGDGPPAKVETDTLD
eukprot:TRINITY_DN49040_c0_g1_i1.p2 TRINITY_DN49040_c0_g1~~TRINITY_DN49040_c0_g1_i1.p2  ORF type:complete len:205 (+),score=69.51 TRINITY_DN49040_c0_g1_i1:56-616(+)